MGSLESPANFCVVRIFSGLHQQSKQRTVKQRFWHPQRTISKRQQQPLLDVFFDLLPCYRRRRVLRCCASFSEADDPHRAVSCQRCCSCHGTTCTDCQSFGKHYVVCALLFESFVRWWGLSPFNVLSQLLFGKSALPRVNTSCGACCSRGACCDMNARTARSAAIFFLS
jgi:hypothetical protein